MKTAEIKFLKICEELDHWKEKCLIYEKKYEEEKEKNSEFVKNGLKLNIERTKEITQLFLDMASDENGKVFLENQRKKQHKKEIIGYKLIKPEYEKAVRSVVGEDWFDRYWHENFKLKGFHFKNSYKIKEAGVLDLWFEPVYGTAKKYPEKWGDVVSENNIEFYTDYDNVKEIKSDKSFPVLAKKDNWTKKEYAEASLALCQLVRLRDIYNDGIELDWSRDSNEKHSIYFSYNKIETGMRDMLNCLLSFHKRKQRDLFLENFKNLIEIAKPLL